MVSNFHLPPTGYGPGSQPGSEDGAELEYLPLPQDMRTYTTRLPDIENAKGLEPAMALLSEVATACETASTGAGARFDLSGLDAQNRALIAETMGEGEVSMRIWGLPAVAAQESVFAGVWVLHGDGLDAIEVAPVPRIAKDRAFVVRDPALGTAAPKPDGIANAPALIVELFDKSARYSPGDEIHVINMSLLPHTEPDLDCLKDALGNGSTHILSRGYGNCRIEATALPHVWRVQFFNSMDTLILDTYEVTEMPEVVLAAPEDLSDSAERIREVMGAIG